MTTIQTGQVIPASQINQWAPPAAIIAYGGEYAPSGWLLCDGASYLRSDYPDLFGIIGTAYGAADGSHFNVPDLRGRVVVGIGVHSDVSDFGKNEGVAAAYRRPKHQHTPHSHTVPMSSVADMSAGGVNVILPSGNTSTSSVDGGSGNANDSVDAPAYLVLNYIIRAKDV